MKNNLFNKIFASLAALVLVAAPAAALAHEGTSGSSGSGCDSTRESCTSLQDTEDGNTSTETKAEAEKHIEIERQEARAEALKHVQELRAKEREHTQEQRKKNCQAAENGLEHKLTNLQKNAAAYKSRIDSALQKAISFHEANNVTPANYDSLLSAAQSAQSQAMASVGALKSLSINLDCSSGSVAENVATFRSAASQARSDLKAYKEAVKAFIKSLKEASDDKTQ